VIDGRKDGDNLTVEARTPRAEAWRQFGIETVPAVTAAGPAKRLGSWMFLGVVTVPEGIRQRRIDSLGCDCDTDLLLAIGNWRSHRD
jgi:hypothetical protein